MPFSAERRPQTSTFEYEDDNAPLIQLPSLQRRRDADNSNGDVILDMPINDEKELVLDALERRGYSDTAPPGAVSLTLIAKRAQAHQHHQQGDMSMFEAAEKVQRKIAAMSGRTNGKKRGSLPVSTDDSDSELEEDSGSGDAGIGLLRRRPLTKEEEAQQTCVLLLFSLMCLC